jgi:hypothetical protein
MRGKTFVTFGVFAVLLVTLPIDVQVVAAQHTANGQGFPLASPLAITSPVDGATCSRLVTLNVTFQFLLSVDCANLTYSVDGGNEASIPLTAKPQDIMATVTYSNGTTVTAPAIFAPVTIVGSVALPELSTGAHTITVSATYHANKVVGLDNKTITVYVDTAAPTATPTETALPSPSNITPTPTPHSSDAISQSSPEPNLSSDLTPAPSPTISPSASPEAQQTEPPSQSPPPSPMVLQAGFLYGAAAGITIGVAIIASIMLIVRKKLRA